MVWSGSRPACLPLPFICLPVLFICLPGWVPVVRFPADLSFVSPQFFSCVSHFLSFVSHFFTCLPLLFICLPGWVLVVPAGLSPTSFRLGACGPVPGWLVSHFLAFVSHFLLFVSHFLPFVPAGLSPTSLICLPFPFNCLPLFHLSPTLDACCRVSARLVSHFLAFVSHFFPKQFTFRGSILYSFVSQVCHWWCPLCRNSVQVCHCWWPPFSAGHVAFLFICLPGLSLVVSALFRWPCNISIHLSPRSVTAGPPFSAGNATFLFIICLPGLSLAVSALFRRCNISIHLFPRFVTASVRPFPLTMQHVYSSPRSVTAGVRPCPLAMQHFYSCVSQACHWSSPPLSAGHVAFLFICLPGLSLVCLCLLAMKHFYSFVSQVRYCWCPPFSVGHASFLFIICLPGLSLAVSALFRWRCNISIHLFPRFVTAGVRPFPLAFLLAM